MNRIEILGAKNASKEDLLAKPNVVGVAIGRKISKGKTTDELSVVVLVEKKLEPISLGIQDVVPVEVFGAKTDVIEVGKLVALSSRTIKHRPAPGGVSIGHFKITAGTLGVAAKDELTGERVILSNNHVLANSNQAMLGDVILQQGYYDGGRVGTHDIAYLLRYKEIDFDEEPATCPVAEGVAKVLNNGAKVIGSRHRIQTVRTNAQAVNYVDAAIARPISDDLILDEILDIGKISGTIMPYLGMPIRKSGRTTGYTHGEVLLLHATVNVGYGGSKVARFEEQIVAGAMSAGGDSGSLGVHEDSNQAFGLLYAGSDKSTIFNPIGEVLSALSISL